MGVAVEEAVVHHHSSKAGYVNVGKGSHDLAVGVDSASPRALEWSVHVG